MTPERCTCDDALRSTHLYIDDALEPQARAVVEDHLASCPACNDKVVFQHTLRATIARAVTREAIPGDLVRRLLDRLDSEPGDSAGA